MSDIAIRVEDLAKLYRIGGPQAKYKTLRDSITDMATAPLRRVRDLMRGQAYGASGLKEEIWALKDVSFEVKYGEVIGIIGRNGAGKSTLLKILARITEPTVGYIELFGRVGALLEVGTGFHPELTGRENIYLNGAILGMSRKEIDRKFDEIVAFAEIERFIDTPVKHYSSGMGLRLGFSVAAHLEPEILIVDEVLAVGDAAFQNKCIGKMKDVAEEGRTVLFVSHDMPSITQLTSSALWLEKGSIVKRGHTVEVVSEYLQRTSTGISGEQRWHDKQGDDTSELRIRAVRVVNENNELLSVIDLQKDFFIEIDYEVCRPIQRLRVYFVLNNDLEQAVLSSSDVDNTEDGLVGRVEGEYRSRCRFPAELLKPGEYFLTVGAVDQGVKFLARHSNVLNFRITPIGLPLAVDWHKREGILTPRFLWQIIQLD